VCEGVGDVAQFVVFGAIGRDLDERQAVSLALGLGEGDLVGRDGERVGTLDPALDLDVVDPALVIGGTDVVAGIVAGHLHRIPADGPFRGQHRFQPLPTGRAWG